MMNRLNKVDVIGSTMIDLMNDIKEDTTFKKAVRLAICWTRPKLTI